MSDESGETVARYRGYLPHWERAGATYFVTFRLADALPRSVVERLMADRRAMEARITRGRRPPNAAERASVDTAIARRVEIDLDTGTGACHLSIPAVAEIVADALGSFDGARYQFYCWSIMPNHVHAVVQPLELHEKAFERIVRHVLNNPVKAGLENWSWTYVREVMPG